MNKLMELIKEKAYALHVFGELIVISFSYMEIKFDGDMLYSIYININDKEHVYCLHLKEEYKNIYTDYLTMKEYLEKNFMYILPILTFDNNIIQSNVTNCELEQIINYAKSFHNDPEFNVTYQDNEVEEIITNK